MRTRWFRWILGLVVLGGFEGKNLQASPFETGGYEGDFLAWGAGARAMALGKAYVALATDATAAYWNPAGLAFAERAGATALHAMLWEGVTYDFAGAVLPTLAGGTIGWFGNFLAVGDLERRDADNNLVAGGFGVTKAATGVGYGLDLSPEFGVGLSVKWLGRWFDRRESGFVSGDVGVRWTPTAWSAVGVTIQQAWTLKYGSTEDLLPRILRVGMVVSPWPDLGLMVGDVEISGEAGVPVRWRIGVESAPIGPLTVRMGMDRWEMAGGIGLKFADLSLDYGGALHQDLGLSHRISMGVQWGEIRSHVRVGIAREAFDRALEALEEARLAGEDAPRAREARDRAAAALEEAVRYDKDNATALKWLERLKEAGR